MRCLRALIPLLLLLLSLVACHPDDPVATRRFEQATRLLPIEPEESLLLLDSIEYPENLNARQNARWCMLKGQVADTIHSPMPYSSQLERAVRYFKREGGAMEQARALFYLGRSYVEERNYVGAQDNYMQALSLAIGEKAWNLAGYICSYIGDVYEFKATYLLSMEKYLEASHYFRQAGNQRSEAFALRDAGREAAFSDSLDMALEYMQKAESLIQEVGDSSDISSVLNGMGNVYQMRGEYEKAKKYLYKAMEFDEKNIVPDYLALSELYLQIDSLERAKVFLEKTKEILGDDTSSNPVWSYNYSLLKELEGDKDAALDFLRQYVAISDSVTLERNDADIIGVEKRYKHDKLTSENRALRISKHRYASLSIFILFIAATVILIYQIRVNRRNRIIIAQQQAMQEKNERLQLLEHELANTNAELNQISTQLEQYKNSRSSEENQALLEQYAERKQEAERLMSQIQKQRQDLFQESAIMKRLLKSSDKVIAGNQKSLLTDKDWKAIYAQVASSYPTAAKFLRESKLTEKEQQLAYLSVFNFEAKREAVLLGAQLDAVNKSRQRLRRKLGITDRNLSLHDYLAGMK